MKLLVFHKPYGVLTQFTDAEGRPTLKDFIPVAGVYPVGRLDRDSEGLLLLTDDGALQHRLSDPRFEHPKAYFAQVERIPPEEALARLRKGVEIQGYRTKPAKVRLLQGEPEPLAPRDPPVRFRKSVPTAWVELTLTEGKNRQVRHMMAAVGYPVLRLIRVATGGLQLGGLRPGEWREVTAAERALLVQTKVDRRPRNKAL